MITIEKLVKKAKKGDKIAFEKLFLSYRDEIYKTAYIYVGNKEDALDVVQESALKSFKSIHTLKNNKYFKTWLIKIVISSSIDILRKNKKIIQINPEYLESIAVTDNENVSLSIYLQNLIQELNEREKSVILLRYFHDNTLQEIAAALNIPLGTTKTILYRSLEKLRKTGKKEDIL